MSDVVPCCTACDRSLERFDGHEIRNTTTDSIPDTPRPQLNTWQLQKYSNGTVFDNELWGANTGVLR